MAIWNVDDRGAAFLKCRKRQTGNWQTRLPPPQILWILYLPMLSKLPPHQCKFSWCPWWKFDSNLPLYTLISCNVLSTRRLDLIWSFGLVCDSNTYANFIPLTVYPVVCHTCLIHWSVESTLEVKCPVCSHRWAPSLNTELPHFRHVGLETSYICLVKREGLSRGILLVCWQLGDKWSYHVFWTIPKLISSCHFWYGMEKHILKLKITLYNIFDAVSKNYNRS